MILLGGMLAISLVLAIAGLVLMGVYNDGLNIFGFIVMATASVAALIFTIFLIVIPVSRHYGRIGCRTFAAQTGRPTKFVIYTTFSTGDCLTPTAKGKWIPTKNLREFGEKP